jgi:hypothetical protein
MQHCLQYLATNTFFLGGRCCSDIGVSLCKKAHGGATTRGDVTYKQSACNWGDVAYKQSVAGLGHQRHLHVGAGEGGGAGHPKSRDNAPNHFYDAVIVPNLELTKSAEIGNFH